MTEGQPNMLVQLNNRTLLRRFECFWTEVYVKGVCFISRAFFRLASSSEFTTKMKKKRAAKSENFHVSKGTHNRTDVNKITRRMNERHARNYSRGRASFWIQPQMWFWKINAGKSIHKVVFLRI